MNLWTWPYTLQLKGSGDTGHFKGRDRVHRKGSSPPTACLTSVTLKALTAFGLVCDRDLVPFAQPTH